jgi:RimJ/RimL family protein N-acetyltransferase
MYNNLAFGRSKRVREGGRAGCCRGAERALPRSYDRAVCRMNVRIRTGAPADAAHLADLASRTFRETFSEGTSAQDMAVHLAEAYGAGQQGRELADPDIVTLVVEAEQQLVAYAQVRRAPAPACVTGDALIELWRFYVDRPWQGRGIAQRLMERVDEEARRLGGKTIWLGVWEHNHRAQAFYRKAGFVDVGAHVFMVGSDAQTDKIFMRAVTQGAAEAPRDLLTERLILTAPTEDDAGEIFERYASDPDVTRCLGWPRHQSVDDTRGFLTFSAAEWERWPAGPYLIRARANGRLLGSTGLGFDRPDDAMTGYVLARDAWGQGYATEALRAMVDLARRLRLMRLYAVCHPAHRASARVLEKCGFALDTDWAGTTSFPNLTKESVQRALCYELRP